MSRHFQAPPLPNTFIWRRIHSLTGLWLVLFLIEHLLTNSQAALLIGEDGNGFVRGVNFIKNLPYLPFIEIILLGIPFIIHGGCGIHYLLSAKYNSFATDGSAPSLGQYGKNKAYTWQRITSWILLVGITAHVIHMRFVNYPDSAQIEDQRFYVATIETDEGLLPLSKRLNFTYYSEEQLDVLKNKFEVSRKTSTYDSKETEQLLLSQEQREREHWKNLIDSQHLKRGQKLAVADSFGLIELLILRNTFKSPIMIVLYTGLVLATCFHAFNGLWTFMISWGITLTERSQKLMRFLALLLMVLISFMGLAAIWGTYWINLRV